MTDKTRREGRTCVTQSHAYEHGRNGDRLRFLRARKRERERERREARMERTVELRTIELAKMKGELAGERGAFLLTSYLT
jgi:hypothetical protein